MTALAHIQQPSPLVHSVPIAGPNSDGRHCSQSPQSVHDPLQGPNGQPEDIIGIAKVIKGHQVVGFIYRTASGRFYAQALAAMPYADQKKVGLVVDGNTAGATPRRFLYSGVKEIGRFPWSDLTLLPCK